VAGPDGLWGPAGLELLGEEVLGAVDELADVLVAPDVPGNRHRAAAMVRPGTQWKVRA
jgi:hypothetical protein